MTAQSKVGIFAFSNGVGVAMRLAEALNSHFVILCDCMGESGWFAQRGMLVVGRSTAAEIDPLAFPSPQAAASHWLENIRPHVLANPTVGMWIANNETGADTPEQHAWLAAYSLIVAQAMEGLGKRAALLNFGAGRPESSDWPTYSGVIARCHAYGHGLFLHEYGAQFPNDEGWLQGRYKHFVDYARSVGAVNVPLYMGEIGADAFRGRPDLMVWPDQYANEPDPARAYVVKNLAPYIRKINAEPMIKGAAIFCAGQIDGQGPPNYGWSKHNIANSAVPTYLIEELNSVPPPPPPPMVPMTNQDAINAFRAACGAVAYWSVIVFNGLAGMVTNRKAIYTGPKPDSLRVTVAERARLIAWAQERGKTW